MNFEIIDFHTHPFLTQESNICNHKQYIPMSPESSMESLKSIGISKICGAVVTPFDTKDITWDSVKALNDDVLELKKLYGDFYVPGFTIHPDFVRESCEEIEAMHKKGINLIGELVPGIHGWSDNYYNRNFSEILDLAEQYDMIVNIHNVANDSITNIIKEHPNLVLVAAHPGEQDVFYLHMERMKISKNYYLDVSGTGIFRHGVLRRGIDLVGAERFLFGSDFPVCNPAMFVGGVANDYLLSDNEKELILSGNAKRLLNLK